MTRWCSEEAETYGQRSYTSPVSTAEVSTRLVLCPLSHTFVLLYGLYFYSFCCACGICAVLVCVFVILIGGEVFQSRKKALHRKIDMAKMASYLFPLCSPCLRHGYLWTKVLRTQ